ncbi:hypothetical protein LguiA_009510 [Lonicera macranthoides]
MMAATGGGGDGGGGGEFSHIDMDESNEEESTQMLFAKRRCCFCIPGFHSSNRSPTVRLNWWHKVRAEESQEGEGLWARGVSAVKKIREWSEIVAGPKWKTFIRRFNRNKSSGGNRQPKYQYDPLSYALNFDQGHNVNSEEEDDDDYRFRNFSARYAMVPISANSSMDLGKDGSNFS